MPIIEINTNKEFKKIIAAGVVLVNFIVPWYGTCRSQGPIIEILAEKYKDRAKIVLINVDINKKISMNFNIKSIPTLIVFDKGKEIQRYVGLQPESTLADAIEKALN
jgi:thioredoxin 1